MSTPGSARDGLSGPEFWCIDLKAASAALNEMERRTPRLSDWDRRHASEMADASAATQWRATHVALRVLLERAVGARWRGAPLIRGVGVRPHLEDVPVAFSLSHVAGLALIAVAPEGDIGVDLERLRRVHVKPPRRGLIEAAGAGLNPRQALPDDAEARFLQAWVRLEAFAKARGSGIGRLLTQLGIVGGRDIAQAELVEAVEAARASAGANAVFDLALGKELFAAVALPPSQALPEVRWLPVSLDGLEELLT